MTLVSSLLGLAVLVGHFVAPDPEVLHGEGVWPLEPTPTVVRGFDAPDSPWGSGHRGVDLSGAPGQVVRSSLPGRVTYAGRLAGRGVVTVNHGQTRTTYEPVTPAVAVGDTVGAGAPLGTLVLPGSHCSPRACLHWGWLDGAAYLDPLDLVGAGRVRLLPLSGLGSVPTAPLAPRLDRRPAPPTPGAAADLPGLLDLTRVGALVGRPSAAAHS